MYQIQPCGYVPPGGGDGGGGGGGGDDEEPPPGSYAFSGSVYVDPDAFTAGLSGTDSLCTGDTGTSIASGGSVTAKRPEQGSPVGVTLSGASYSVGVSNGADTYTLALNLPFPPADPDNPLQCACNADPSNPYRCVYTNQEPNTGPKNFFVAYGGEPTTAWFQTLGGSSFAFGSIESKIPFDTCSAPLCIPALIARDPAGTLDSPGFALTGTGAVVTSDTGGVYIHEADGRSNALQAEALGVRVPTENYDYFFSKFGAKAVTLPNAGKPIVDNELNVFAYNGDLTLDNTNPWNLTSSEKIIVFVNGDLTIDDTPSGENRITSVAEGGDAFLMFITRGDILVTSDVGYDDITTDPTEPNVANVEGVFVADGTLTIASTNGAGIGEEEEETVDPLNDTLMAYWKLDEASGDRTDSVGGNTLTDNNTVASGVGKLGNSADIEEANSEFLRVADNASLSMGDQSFSIAAWVNLESISGNIRRVIAGKANTNTTADREYALYYDSADNRFKFNLVNGSGTQSIAIANNAGAASVGTWYHVVGTYNAATDALSITVNNGTPNTVTHAGGTWDGSNPFIVGRGFAAASNHYFDGRIDELGVWKRVLTSEEITQLYNSGAGTNAFLADGGGGGGSTADRKFIGAGTFVGWSGVVLERNFDDGSNPLINSEAPTEVFIFRPDFIINAPREVKSAQMTWREIEPQF